MADTGVLMSGVYPGPIDTEMAQEMDKANPLRATAIADGLENGDDYFPDAFAEQFGQGYLSNPTALEKGFQN